MALEIKSNKRGGNLRNRRAKGHLGRGRSLERREEAKARQEAYGKLSLDEKIAQQLAHHAQKVVSFSESDELMGKQLKKLLARKEKQK